MKQRTKEGRRRRTEEEQDLPKYDHRALVLDRVMLAPRPADALDGLLNRCCLRSGFLSHLVIACRRRGFISPEILALRPLFQDI